MNNNDLTNRFYYIYRFIVIVCIILCVRIIYINVVEGEYYSNIANDSIYKDITIPAPRGEIRDRNGILLAGNKPIFTVKISKNEIDRLGKTDKQKKEQINIIALKLSNILIKNKEK